MKTSASIITVTLLAVLLASMLNATSALPVASQHRLSDEAMIPVLVVSENDLTTYEVAELNRLGVVTTTIGQVAVIHTRSSNLTDLENLPFVSEVPISHPLNVYLDKSVPDIGADGVWAEIKDPFGRNVTGAGVVVGIVDTGIDTTHPDFFLPNGTTKILFVWDQTTPGRPPENFGYGFECNARDIQLRVCPEFDSFGHGTHVAGIASSSGRATGNYKGVAPGSSIIFVKSGHEVCDGGSWTFNTAQILDGVNYIVKKAARLGMRAVINLSLGGNAGGHDGTDPLELGLDAFVKAGTPVVVAAGNVALDSSHVKGRLSKDASVTLNIAVRETVTDLLIDLWYSPNDKMNAVLSSPDGQRFTIPTPRGGAKSSYGNVTALANFSNHGNELYLEVNSTAPLPTEGWTVTLTAGEVNSNGEWDAWIDTAGCSFPGAFFNPGDGYDIDPHDTIGIPGTARYVVTVGAYVTKTSWRGMNNQTLGAGNLGAGAIAPFSSLGPTRDGRVKPDIVAPGMVITSARSSFIPSKETDPDGYHRVLAGTSMSAPHVAGAIALVLQFYPRLPATEIARYLSENARFDANTGFANSGSPTWGFGKADARTATGFFRVTLVTKGVPESMALLVDFDSKRLEVVGGSWTDIYFLKGTELKVSLEKEVQGTPGTRYVLEKGELAVTGNSIINYTVQYYLTVDSQFGTATGSGWYNANTTARFSSPRRIPATGLFGYLGAEYILVSWITDDGKVSSDSVTMDRPRSVTAAYALTYPIQALALFAIIFGAVVILAVFAVKRRNLS